ncbi:arrestin [Xylogone sp. PMI_703]|nr:arrestin [Xylogone sp. PMI_703]
MCAAPTPATSTSIASAGQSLLSRLALPLRSRTRNLTDFHIRLDDPYRKYSPGDVVKGAVVITVVKPVRITHITVCLHGFVRVFKNPSNRNDPLPELLNSANPRKSQYLGNGHASLFQDEVTLCGEGRIESGVYEFNFELEFPSKGIPTSIDFERGTISYLVTATITRPTSIAATMTCDQKVSLVETVDVGPMLPPRARTISLEPITKRKRRRTLKSVKSVVAETTDGSSGSDGRRAASVFAEELVSQSGSTEGNVHPQSPRPSEVQSDTSADSMASGSTDGRSVSMEVMTSSAKFTIGSQESALKEYVADKTIVANIELLKSGCLPGDNIPVKIYIKHTKVIKSMHGVIITLYRQGRIDSAPPLSLFTDLTGKEAARLKHEDYYPKSRTGLGGLSLMSAGTSSLFRKDLSQTFAPLIVDPSTLVAVVNASIRVPEDVFPTISGVPGEMISFKYHVEVVLDLGGRLAGQQRHIPRIGAMTLPSTYGNSSSGRADSNTITTNANMLSAWGGSIVDTDHIRREKSVVACLFEVIVGTTDSARKRSKITKLNAEGSTDAPTSPGATHDIPAENQQDANAGEESYAEHDVYADQYHNSQYGTEYHDYYSGDASEYEQYPGYSNHPGPQAHIPPPEVPEENDLGEKERIRRAEERLLPSQPPVEGGEASSSRAAFIPSAPNASFDEPSDDIYNAEDAPPSRHPHTTTFHPDQPPIISTSSSNNTWLPSAPTLEDLTPTGARPTDDKQELERQRLMAEASAPLEYPEAESSVAASNRGFEPSAPLLVEGDEYGPGHAHADAQPESSGGEASGRSGDVLPRYER